MPYLRSNKFQGSFGFFSSTFNLVVIRACCKSSAMLIGVIHFGKIPTPFFPYLFIYLFIYLTTFFIGTKTLKPPKLET